MSSLVHGTERAWRTCRELNGGVACEQCVRAKNEAWKQQTEERRNKPIPATLGHGEYVHRHYGCNCDICIADTRTKTAERKRNSRKRRSE